MNTEYREDLKKKINFDPALLYYSTPKGNNDELTKTSTPNVETYNSSNRKHSCVICSKRFFTKNSLETHMALHPSDKLHNISVEKDDTTDWKNRFVLNKGISCSKNDCNFIALDAVEYSKHIATCEGIRLTKEKTTAYCEICDCYYSCANYYEAHSILQHSETGPNISLQDGDVKNTKISDPVSLYLSENIGEMDRSSKNILSHSMYPDSMVTKKKSKFPETEVSLFSVAERVLPKMNRSETSNTKSDQIINFCIPSSITETVEGLNPAITTDIDKISKISIESNSTNDIQMPASSEPTAVETFKGSKKIINLLTEKQFSPEETSTEMNSFQSNNVSSEFFEYSSQLSEETTEAANVLVSISKKSIFEACSCVNDTNRNIERSVGESSMSPQVEKTNTSVRADVEENQNSKLENLERNSQTRGKTSGKNTFASAVINENCSTDAGTDHRLSTYSKEERFEVTLHSGLAVHSAIVNDNASDPQSLTPMVGNLAEIESNTNPTKKDRKSRDIGLSKTVLDPRQCKDDASPAVSHKLFEKKYSKSYNKKTGNFSKISKSHIVHSTPKSLVSTTSERNTVEHVSSVRKSASVTLDSDDLNVKQRSIRQRKKLILPDFEYGLDQKAEFSDSSANENTSSFSMDDGEPVKKRGRPRKKPHENLNKKAVVLEKEIPIASAKKTNFSSTSLQYKIRGENDGNPKEFSLNTTVNESDRNAGLNDSYCADESLNDSKLDEIIQEENDDPNDDIHSWLKKVDFSEQTSFTSWCENPKKKKKLGRPPKGRPKIIEISKNQPKLPSYPVVNAVKTPVICNGDSRVIIKKKKGRPSLKAEPVVIKHLRKEEKVTLKDSKEVKSTQVQNNLETPAVEVSPKKRGRPCKVKADSVSDAEKISPSNLVDEMENKLKSKDIGIEVIYKPETKIETVANSKSEENEAAKANVSKPESSTPQVLAKKRGRPRKSVDNVESVESKNMESVELNDASVIDTPSVNQSILIEAPSCSSIMENSSNNNTDLSKIDDHQSESKGSLLKKRGRPMKKKSLLMKKKELHMCDQNLLWKDHFLSDKSSFDVSFGNDGNLPLVLRKETVDQELTSTLNELRPRESVSLEKNDSAKQTSISEEKFAPDETAKIDENLYRADLRNKSKFSRVFKKSVIAIDEATANSLVVCGRCQKTMTKRHYFKYHQLSHYFLCWLEGEPEINLTDDAEISKILQSYVNPDALRKKAIRLSCELCDKVMKSVVGYVSHVRFCQKKDEGELLEKCTLCERALKPSSIRHHYIKFHGVTKFASTSDSKLIPVECMENRRDSLCKQSEDTMSLAVRNVQMGFERVPVEKVDVLNDEHFWKSLKTSCEMYMCMGLSCRHMTLGKDDLKSHILSCSASFCEFSCTLCPYTTKYESEMIYHAKRKCKETSDSEDNVEEKPELSSDRRVSTRVKKRKFVFDYDDCIDVDRSKKQKDDDFKFENDAFNDESYEDAASKKFDLKEKKSRFSKKKSENIIKKVPEESGLRHAFMYHYTTRTFDPLAWTVDVRLKTFSSTPVLMDLRVDINEWETFPISDFMKHSPLQHRSPKVSFDDSPFVQMKIFDSNMIKGVPVCYTGGPVWSMAWAPLPAHVAEQYLAVSGLQHMNHLVDLSTPVEFPSIVQIWKFGSLDNISNDIHAPTLAWAIAHNFGAVWSMEWCPSGGFDNSSTPYRLGILALATSAGCGVLYSMPRLDCGGETRSIVANPEPDLILKVRCDDIQCSRIVWKRNQLPDTIFGGFSNGIIALWNVSSTSSILRKGKTLYPYRTFEAHVAPITALDVHWLDNGRFMVTSSSDRILKYWDLEDLSGPMYEHELMNNAVSAVWMHHWVVTANGLDFINPTEPTSFVGHPRDLVDRKKPIISIKDTFWSVAYSDWNDSVAVASNGGCVDVYAARHMSALTFKTPDFEKIVTQTVLVPLSEKDKNVSESVEESTGLPPARSSFDCTSVIQNYGLKFCDRMKNKPSADSLNFTIDEGNIRSVNKVCWNQNYNSFNWLAVGYECGFVRVIRVERFDKSHLTKFYKMNENNTITSI